MRAPSSKGDHPANASSQHLRFHVGPEKARFPLLRTRRRRARMSGLPTPRSKRSTAEVAPELAPLEADEGMAVLLVEEALVFADQMSVHPDYMPGVCTCPNVDDHFTDVPPPGKTAAARAPGRHLRSWNGIAARTHEAIRAATAAQTYVLSGCQTPDESDYARAAKKNRPTDIRLSGLNRTGCLIQVGPLSRRTCEPGQDMKDSGPAPG